jgi:hypothetical protein
VIELRTAASLKVYRNQQGFLVSDLKDTVLLEKYTIRLPRSYHTVFYEHGKILMYNGITIEGQDIVITALRPSCLAKTQQAYLEWMTLPEVLGTFKEDRFDIFKTSFRVTAASTQNILPRFGDL